VVVLHQEPDISLALPKASLILIDISGVMPARWLSTRDSITRDTPMCLAKAVTLIGMLSRASL